MAVQLRAKWVSSEKNGQSPLSHRHLALSARHTSPLSKVKALLLSDIHLCCSDDLHSTPLMIKLQILEDEPFTKFKNEVFMGIGVCNPITRKIYVLIEALLRLKQNSIVFSEEEMIGGVYDENGTFGLSADCMDDVTTEGLNSLLSIHAGKVVDVIFKPVPKKQLRSEAI